MSEVLQVSSPCRILVRSKQGLEIYTLPERPNDPIPEQRSDPFLLKGLSTFQQTAPDGSAVYVHVVNKGVFKISLLDDDEIVAEDQEVFLADTANVQMLHLSPNGTYLLTWERWYADKCPNNLKVWSAESGKLLTAFAQKTLKRDAWPYLFWTFDEQYAFLLAAGGQQVQIYPVANIVTDGETRYTDKLKIPGMMALSLPQTPPPPSGNNSGVAANYYFTSFCPGTKDKPAKASLHVYNPAVQKSGGSSSTTNYPALMSKSLFQAEEMKPFWSPLNDAALISLATSVDTSGESYYGSSQLFLLHSLSKEVIAVPTVAGPISDVAWMPNPEKPACFVSIAGKMPSMAVLHHGVTGQPTFQFGNAHRNTVSWSPHGRFLCLAGFGNLAGGMGFWDRNKLKLIPGANPANAAGVLQASEPVVGYGWSPDSRLFAVSTCTPRMNVDNGIHIFTYAGVEITSVPWNNAAQYKPDKLLQAQFVPARLGHYPDRPQTPTPAHHAAGSVSATASTATQQATVAAPPTPAAAPVQQRYVPPSARNRPASGNSLAERLRREKEGNLQGAQKVGDTTPKQKSVVTGTTVVGLVPAAGGAASNKNKARREKAKAKKQQQQPVEPTGAVAETTATAEPTPAVGEQNQATQEDPEKRARKLNKILKQIDDLKAKDPSTLNDDQKNKIASEPDIRQELQKLAIGSK